MCLRRPVAGGRDAANKNSAADQVYGDINSAGSLTVDDIANVLVPPSHTGRLI